MTRPCGQKKSCQSCIHLQREQHFCGTVEARSTLNRIYIQGTIGWYRMYQVYVVCSVFLRGLHFHTQLLEELYFEMVSKSRLERRTCHKRHDCETPMNHGVS